jgi:hypothetical protein
MYKLSPSSLTFQWDDCKYCFYMQVKHGISWRPPGIFGRMANLTSAFYDGKPAHDISPSLPPGIVRYREQFVTSLPINIPGARSQCYIKGRFDAVIAFDDGSYGIIDYKTSDAKAEQAAFYSRQLSAYAYALENAAPKALSLSPVTRLGLFVITPSRFEAGRMASRSSNHDLDGHAPTTGVLHTARRGPALDVRNRQVRDLRDVRLPSEDGGARHVGTRVHCEHLPHAAPRMDRS